MSQVIQYTSASVVDTKIQLGEDQMARSLRITGSWNTIRLGSRICISSSVSKSLECSSSMLKFFYGMSSGTSQAYAHSQSLNAFGVGWKTGSYGELLDSGSSFSGSTNNLRTVRRDYNTVSSYNGIYNVSQSGWYFHAAKCPTRSMFVIEIAKGSPSYTTKVFCPNITASMVDTSLDDLLNVMTMPTMSFAGYTLQGPTTTTYSETSGSLNSINIYWGSALKPLEVSEVVYVRVN